MPEDAVPAPPGRPGAVAAASQSGLLDWVVARIGEWSALRRRIELWMMANSRLDEQHALPQRMERWIRAHGRAGARIILVAGLCAIAVATAAHLLALAARDRMLGQDTARQTVAATVEGGEADPASSVDHDVGRARMAGDHLLLEHDDGVLTALHRGSRTGETVMASAGTDWWRRTVLDPLTGSGFVEAMLQVDPWLTAGRFAPRALGSRRDCPDCPAMTLLSPGWLETGGWLWRRRSGTKPRQFIFTPALAITREPLRTVPCAWRDDPCSQDPGPSATVPLSFDNPVRDPRLARLIREERYRFFTADEAAGFAGLAARDPRLGARLSFSGAPEWTCDTAASGAPTECVVRRDPDEKSSVAIGVRIVRPACCERVPAPRPSGLTGS